MDARPDGPLRPERKFRRWLAVLRVLLAGVAVVDLVLLRSAVPADVLALGACLPLEGRGVPSHLLGIPAAALGAWSVHRTGLEAATGPQLALFALPLAVALVGTLRAEAPLYRVP